MSTNDLPNDSSEGTIDVDLAIEMARNWRTYLETSGQAFDVRSWLIPRVSYDNLLKNNPTMEAVRAYIGLRDPADPTSSQILLVPVVDGHDQLFQGTQNGGVGGDDGDSNVYDMSQPCPPTCGVGGGLEA
ncbi:MAG: hypothetical protein V4553_16305 [Bacteroidota bacterium]